MSIENCLISIIVPVYNTAKYLEKCLDSIVNQTFGNYMLYLIDDYSTDGSYSICEKYANEYENIKLIKNTENRGESYSRNQGLDLVKSKYIAYVDSDDYMEREMLEKMYNCAEKTNADIVMIDVYDWHDNIKKVKLPPNQLLCGDIKTNSIKKANTEQTFPYLWRCLYKFEKVSELRFATNLKYAADTAYNLEAFLIVDSIFYLSESLYHYRCNPNGLVLSVKKDYLGSLTRLFNRKLEIYRNFKMPEEHVTDLCIYGIQKLLMLLIGDLFNITKMKNQVNSLREIRNSELVKFSFNGLNKPLSKLDVTGFQKVLIVLLKIKAYTAIVALMKIYTILKKRRKQEEK